MNVWIRGRLASLTAPQARRCRPSGSRASPQTTGPLTVRAIACTASKSPGEVIGNPASITSTPSRASWRAISTFSCGVQRDPRRLLAVPQRRVEDLDPLVLLRPLRLARRRRFDQRSSADSFSLVGRIPLSLAAIAPPSAIPPGGGGEGEARGWSAGGSSGRDSSGDGESCNHHGSCFPMNRDKTDSRTVFRIVAVAILTVAAAALLGARRRQGRHDDPLVRDGGSSSRSCSRRPSS